ncbi:ribosome-binding ATPase YchF [bacterium BMS3Abin04]|nr:ribosome-binding ATPase YchF [bacterium BMS3Abin04]
MQIGLVGLHNSGKTLLLNTLAGIEKTEYHKSEEAKLEVIKVPDERLNNLTYIFNPKKQVNATIEIFDIPGLRVSDDGKVRITTSFLNNVKNNDALFYVIRHFENASVPHPMNRINSLADIEFLETEFLFSDLSFLENRIEKLKKDILKRKEDRLTKELEVIEKCYEHTNNELPLRTLDLNEKDISLLSGFQLLTLKPLAIAINFDENSMQDASSIIGEIKEKLGQQNLEIIPFSAEIEYELSKLEPEDQQMFMEEYGIKESALDKILRTAFKVLGLQSFFTVGEDETRAWTIKKNYTAQQAAGVIHTDFYNKFIRAEVVHYDDFMKYKSFSKCKEAGVWRLEGKEYIVADGDILNIRHS